MTLVIADSDSLIKITKAGLKEEIIAHIQLVVPPLVEHECVAEGLGKPDALLIERNVAQQKIKVMGTHPHDQFLEREIKDLQLKGGEQDVYRLAAQQRHNFITSDDQKFLKVLHLLNKDGVTPASLVVWLYKNKKCNKEKALGMLRQLQPYVSITEYDLSRREIGG